MCRISITRHGSAFLGITLDVLEYARSADVAVLASGDGDFDLPVQKIRDKYQVSAEAIAQEATR
jgi:uncharacterized LabA/DUF88 family protein